MSKPHRSALSESRPRYWLRVLRPLSWWLLLVLALYGIRTHQRWMEQTRLVFTISVNGRTDYSDPTATLDGQTASSGQRVSLGKHQFAVMHPKGMTYTTNLFIWYGGHNFGKIDLLRAKGTLAVTVNPPAPQLTIRGPEFSVTLTNSNGLSTSVPTDQYVVEAQYRHWETSRPINVLENVPNTLAITPKLGALQLSCNQSEATFQLLRGDDEIMDSGAFPATIVELSEGTYNLVAWHHKRRWDVRPEVKSGATNEVLVEIKYGSAILETKPPGASVTGSDGHYWGTTPLQLAELQPGTWRFSLRLDNFETVATSLAIVADATNTIRTNLISQSFTGAMRAARQSMDTANYDSAIEHLGDALRANPNDPAAGSLLREATGLRSIRLAEALGKNGDYIAGGMELKTALEFLPDNTRAKQMVADFKQHEPEQLERMRVERLERPKKTFGSIISQISGASMFESHELKTEKPVKEVHAAITTQLQSVQPNFQVIRSALTPATELFRIEASQAFSGGSRRCVIVGGQSRENETRIFFTVLESKKVGFMSQPITSLVGATPLEYTLVDPKQPQLSDKLKNQITEGVSNVTARIQGAIGQTPAPAAP